MNPLTIQESSRLEFISQLEETFPYLGQEIQDTVVTIFLKQFDNYEKFQKKINKLTIDPVIKENIVAVAYQFFSKEKIENEIKNNKRKRNDIEDNDEDEAKRQCVEANLDPGKKRKGGKLEKDETKKRCLQNEKIPRDTEFEVAQSAYIEDLFKQRNPDIIPLAFTGTDEQLIQACEHVYQFLKAESIDFDNRLEISAEHVDHFMMLLSHINPQVALSAWRCFTQMRKRVLYQTSFVKDNNREKVMNLLEKFIYLNPEYQDEVWMIQLKLYFNLFSLEECITFLSNPVTEIQQLALGSIRKLILKQPHVFQDTKRCDPHQLIKTILDLLVNSSKETSRTCSATLMELVKIPIFRDSFCQNQGSERIIKMIKVYTENYQNSIGHQKQQNSNLNMEDRDADSIFLARSLIIFMDCINAFMGTITTTTTVRLSQVGIAVVDQSTISYNSTVNLFSSTDLENLIDQLLILLNVEVSNDLNERAINCFGILIRKLPNQTPIFKCFEPIFALLEKDDPKIITSVLWSLSAMASEPKNKEFLLKHQAMDKLIHYLSHANDKVIMGALCCLNWAQLTETSLDNIFEEKILSKLVSKNEEVISQTLQSILNLCDGKTVSMQLHPTLIKELISFVKSSDKKNVKNVYWILGKLVRKGLAQEVYDTGILKNIKTILSQETDTDVIEAVMFCMFEIEINPNIITIESAQEKIDYLTHLLTSSNPRIVESAAYLLYNKISNGFKTDVNESSYNQIIHLLASQDDILVIRALLNFREDCSLPENYNNLFNIAAIESLTKTISKNGKEKILALRSLENILSKNPQPKFFEYLLEKNFIKFLIDQLKFENEQTNIETTIEVIASISSDLDHLELIRTYLTGPEVIRFLQNKNLKTVEEILFCLNNLMIGAPSEIYIEQQADIIALTIPCIGSDNLNVAQYAMQFLNKFLLLKKDLLEKDSFSGQSAISSVIACFNKPNHAPLFPKATKLLITLICLGIDQSPSPEVEILDDPVLSMMFLSRLHKLLIKDQSLMEIFLNRKDFPQLLFEYHETKEAQDLLVLAQSNEQIFSYLQEKFIITNDIHAFFLALKVVKNKERAVHQMIETLKIASVLDKEAFFRALDLISLIHGNPIEKEDLVQSALLEKKPGNFVLKMPSDLTLTLGANHIECHQLILAHHSPVFHDLLVSKPEKNKMICLDSFGEMELLALKKVIAFFYQQECEIISREEAFQMLLIAEKFSNSALEDHCIAFFSDHITQASLPDVLEKSSKLKSPKLKFAIMIWLMKNYNYHSNECRNYLSDHWFLFYQVLCGKTDEAKGFNLQLLPFLSII